MIIASTASGDTSSSLPYERPRLSVPPPARPPESCKGKWPDAALNLSTARCPLPAARCPAPLSHSHACVNNRRASILHQSGPLGVASFATSLLRLLRRRRTRSSRCPAISSGVHTPRPCSCITTAPLIRCTAPCQSSAAAALPSNGCPGCVLRSRRRAVTLCRFLPTRVALLIPGLP
jgi:hypothetical protein